MFSFSKKRQCQAAYSLEGTAMIVITSAPSGIGMSAIDRKAATTSAPVIIRVALQLLVAALRAWDFLMRHAQNRIQVEKGIAS